MPNNPAAGALQAKSPSQRALDHPERPRILPPPKMPMDVARQYLKEHHLYDELLTLRHWHGGWWYWRGSHWSEIDDRCVRSWLYGYTEHAVYGDNDGLAPWAPTRHKIVDLADALASTCYLDREIEQPCWLSGTATETIVSCANGLLDVQRRQLLPHTLDFFNQTAVPFNYDPNATEPERWIDFLQQLWPGEPESVDVLGEWFGYLISGRTDLHNRRRCHGEGPRL